MTLETIWFLVLLCGGGVYGTFKILLRYFLSKLACTSSWSFISLLFYLISIYKSHLQNLVYLSEINGMVSSCLINQTWRKKWFYHIKMAMDLCNIPEMFNILYHQCNWINLTIFCHCLNSLKRSLFRIVW